LFLHNISAGLIRSSAGRSAGCRNGYLIEGKPARFDALSAETRAFIRANSLEWRALTMSSDAFPMLDREKALS
jgi:hypothetical protein